MENRKGLMPGTRTSRRQSAGFPINGSYGGSRSGKRSVAMRAGLSEQHTLTREERKRAASARATSGPEGFHGSKRGSPVASSRPRASTPTRHHGRVHKGETYH